MAQNIPTLRAVQNIQSSACGLLKGLLVIVYLFGVTLESASTSATVVFGTYWYFWLTIQNTASRQVRNLFYLVAVFISFPWRTGAESPALLALENPILGPKVPDRGSPSLARFSAPKKKRKKRKEKKSVFTVSINPPSKTTKYDRQWRRDTPRSAAIGFWTVPASIVMGRRKKMFAPFGLFDSFTWSQCQIPGIKRPHEPSNQEVFALKNELKIRQDDGPSTRLGIHCTLLMDAVRWQF
jgi:hypothetical protein